ncbi:MAG: CBS domain-containing protein [Planctomycetes bacterium]|nr:CBS domain-containing protein [Planctomycetota bacterium]
MTDMQRPAMRKLGCLNLSERKMVSVCPDESIETALTQMLAFDFDQLPILDPESRPLGVLRWTSITRRLLDGEKPASVRDWMVEARTVSEDRSIHDVFPDVLRHDYVIVVDKHGKATGIVTVWDLCDFSNKVLVPYLVIEQVELQLREIISKYNLDGEPVKNEKPKYDVPSLGYLIRKLENPDNWARINTKLSRTVVISALKKVNSIRNNMMHYKANQLHTDDVHSLELIGRFVAEVGFTGPTTN